MCPVTLARMYELKLFQSDAHVLIIGVMTAIESQGCMTTASKNLRFYSCLFRQEEMAFD